MILDSQERFSNGQAISGVVGTVVSTDVYDTGAAADVGAGEELYLFSKLDTALAGAGSSIQAVLQDSADNSSFADVMGGPVIALAAALVNTPLAKMRLPLGLRRYLRVAYKTTGATSTGGTASSYLAKDVQANTTYPTSIS